MPKGTFCISIDTELLWGRWNINYQDFEPRAAKVRNIIKDLLTIFDKYDIPATWAIVGSLYLSPTQKEKETDLWRAPDIITQIKNQKNQEIACHSFTHPEFTELNHEEAENEIINCIKLAKRQNIKLESFVFPKNIISHLQILQKYHFLTYRGRDRRNWELFALSYPPVYEPIQKNGLINIPGSMYFVSGRGPRKFIPGKLRVLKAKMGLNRAIREKKIFHLWFHPIDLADEPTKLLGALESIFSYAAKQREKGTLEIKTMSKIAHELKK